MTTHFVLDARTATPHFPGIGRYVTSLAQALIPQLTPQESLTLLHDPAYPLSLPDSPAVQAVPVNISPFSPSQQWELPPLLRSLHASCYHSAYYLMPYRPGVPTVLTVYDLIPMLLPEASSQRARLLFRSATSLALNASRHILTISEATRTDLLANFSVPAARVHTISLAADPIFRPLSADAQADFRTHRGLPQRYMLYLGSNKPHKNLVRLIEAWDRVIQFGPGRDLPLVIAGAWDSHYPEARRRATELELDNPERVRWLGPVPEAELPYLYGAALGFVFPSRYEGFGLPVLEAMASGVPVACSNVSSLPEVAGDAALLFDPKDVQSIAVSLRRLIEEADLRTDLRRRGLERAAGFTWKQAAAETLACYRSL